MLSTRYRLVVRVSMTRSWRPDDDPSPPQRSWWAVAVAAVGAPAGARQGRGRRSKAGAARSAARQPACCGHQPAPAAVTEHWPWWPIRRLVVPVEGDTNRARRRAAPGCPELLAGSAVDGRRPRRPVAGGSAVWPSPGPPAPAPAQEPPRAAVAAAAADAPGRPRSDARR